MTFSSIISLDSHYQRTSSCPYAVIVRNTSTVQYFALCALLVWSSRFLWCTHSALAFAKSLVQKSFFRFRSSPRQQDVDDGKYTDVYHSIPFCTGKKKAFIPAFTGGRSLQRHYPKSQLDTQLQHMFRCWEKSTVGDRRARKKVNNRSPRSSSQRAPGMAMGSTRSPLLTRCARDAEGVSYSHPCCASRHLGFHSD